MLKRLTSGLPIKNYNVRDPYVMFEVENLWNGVVKKDVANFNLVLMWFT